MVTLIVNDGQSVRTVCQYFHCIAIINLDSGLIGIFSGRCQRLEGAEDAGLQALRGNQPDRFAKNCMLHILC